MTDETWRNVYATRYCPVCQRAHSIAADGEFAGPHVCPEFMRPVRPDDGKPWCSTCQTGCARLARS